MTPQQTGMRSGLFCGLGPAVMKCDVGYIWCCIVCRRNRC